MDVDPTQGGAVVKVAIVNGVGSLPPSPTKLLNFSGYDWKVRMVSADRGGLNNLYDADNAVTDADGSLHLKITKKSGRWTCAQLVLTRSLGYGTYIFVVRETSHLEPAAVLSMHTFDQGGGEQHYREMDVEISRWGDAADKYNAQYGVQPFYVPGNVFPFQAPSGPLVHTMHWQSGRVSFKTTRGSAEGPLVSEHEFTSGVPTPGQERVEFNFYLVTSEKSPLQKGGEIIVEKFEYLP